MVSLVIPVHQGSDFIADSLVEVRRFLEGRSEPFEIVVVDDGSNDGTAAVIEPMTDDRLRLVSLPANLGKYGALKAGMKVASGGCRIFTDADLPYDLEAVPYMVDLISNGGYDLVVGDRTLAESEPRAAAGLARRLSSRAFAHFVRLLVTGGIFDSQCGLKGFRSEVADALFPLVMDNSFSGDVELLYVALKHNLSIRRIPVRLQRAAPSTVRLSHHSLPMLFRILRLRHNWNRGAYRSENLSRIASQAYWSPSESEARVDRNA